MKNPDLINAIIECEPKCICKIVGEQVYSNVTWLNEHVPSEDDVNKKLVELQAEYDALEYARKRQAEYPDWGTQLNKIYDDGITKWKAEMVDPIKAKYPKP